MNATGKSPNLGFNVTAAIPLRRKTAITAKVIRLRLLGISAGLEGCRLAFGRSTMLSVTILTYSLNLRLSIAFWCSSKSFFQFIPLRITIGSDSSIIIYENGHRDGGNAKESANSLIFISHGRYIKFMPLGKADTLVTVGAAYY